MPRLCIVTDEFVTICGHGGIGACSLGLASHFEALGYDVDVLITHPEFKSARDGATSRFRVFSLNECALDDPDVLPPHDAISAAYAVYRFLRDRPYASVHFNDWAGSGFYVAMARRQGSFAATVVTHLHGSSEWVRSYNLQPPTMEDLEREAIERSQIENSDIVIAPSAYLLEWYRAKGVILPRAEALNWILPQWTDEAILSGKVLTTRAVQAGDVSELIFFGRHERRKGFEIFIGAVGQLPPDLQVDLTFIGRFDRIGGEYTGSYALRHLSRYRGRIRFFNDLGQKEAFQFIRNSTNALCVMPSLIENSPCVVGECFSAAIPFISTDVGGIAELIDPNSRPYALAKPHAHDLAGLLRRALRNGMPPLVSTLVPDRIGRRWADMAEALHELPPPARPSGPDPLVSVCFTHYERPALLERALRAIDRQDYAAFEIIVVDDGSPSFAVQRELDRIESLVWAHPLRIVRSENRYLGAARNRAASEATGEYLLFHDDDNVAEPGQIRKFVEAARTIDADILTCIFYAFREPEHGSLIARKQIEYFPIGIGGTFSFFRNRFGDANALIRRSVFTALGGFSEHHGVGWEDWELFLRAYIKKFRSGIVPEPLFNYRVSSTGMLSMGDPVRNAERLFEAVEILQPNLGSEVFRLAQREPLLQQIKARTWDQLGLSDHGSIHRELMALEPNSDGAKAKLSDLAFAMGRMEDAIHIGMNSFEQRERLFHLVKMMRPGRAYLADLDVVQVVQPSDRSEFLLLKGWLAGRRGVVDCLGLQIDKRHYDVVSCSREGRSDVKEHLGLPTEADLGFTILAKPRDTGRSLRPASKEGWLRAGTPPGQSHRSIRMLVGPHAVAAHIDAVTPCHVTPVDVEDDVIFVDVETSDAVDTWLVSSDGQIQPGYRIDPRRQRFNNRSTGGQDAIATVVVPNSIRADVIVGRAVTPRAPGATTGIAPRATDAYKPQYGETP